MTEGITAKKEVDRITCGQDSRGARGCYWLRRVEASRRAILTELQGRRLGETNSKAQVSKG